MNDNYKKIVKEIFLKEKITICNICNTQNSYNSKVFKIIGEGQNYIIKFYKNTPKRLCEEKYLNYLKEYLHVASIISSSSFNNYDYIIMECLEGKNISDEDANLLSDEQMYRVGNMLGTLHSVPIKDNDDDSWIKYLYKCLEISEEALKEIFPDENIYIQNYLKNKIKTLIENNYKNCILHMDFRFGNFIFNDNDISLIDFESTKNGDYVFDFVKINKLSNEQGFKSILNGYNEKKKLDNDFIEKLEFYSLFDSYTSLYWCVVNNQMEGNFYKINYEKVNKFLEEKNEKRIV